MNPLPATDSFIVCGISDKIFFGLPDGITISISGGLFKESSDKDTATLQPVGLLQIGPDAWRFVESVVTQLIDPEDNVLIVRENRLDGPASKITTVPDDCCNITADTTLVRTFGHSIGSIQWCQDSNAGSRIHVFAYKNSRGRLIKRILRRNHPNSKLNLFFMNYWMSVSPQIALDDLGNYHLFTYRDGYDMQDICIQLPQADTGHIREILTKAAAVISLPVYFGDTVISDPESTFWTEGYVWHNVPANWTRID